MKGLSEFLKATAAGGLFVLLPVLLLYLLLAEALELVVALATPITGLFPKGTFDEVKFPTIIALVLIVGVSFLIGLGLRSSVARRLGLSIERTVLARLPMYDVLKRLTRGFSSEGQHVAFKPAMLISQTGDRELAYVVEDHNDGNVTILLPWAPTPFAGTVKIIKREQVETLNVNLSEFTKIVSQWGVGARDLLVK
jgi:uncharacterized membrane protein